MGRRHTVALAATCLLPLAACGGAADRTPDRRVEPRNQGMHTKPDTIP